MKSGITRHRVSTAVCVTTASLITIFFGCSKDSPTGPGNNEDIRFPLAIGNEWVYRCTYNRTTITADDTTSESSTGEITWKIAILEQALGQEAYRMKITQKVTSGPDSGSVFAFKNWYTEQDSMLVAVASDSNVGYAPYLEGQLYKPAARKDEIYSWGVTVLKYPLTPGTEWKYLYSDKKRVEAREKITVNGQQFDAARIVRNLELDIVGDNPNETWPALYKSTQWFAKEGLAKSTMTSEYTKESEAREIHESFVQELVSFALK